MTAKLTSLPVGDVDLDEYARLDGAEFTGEVTFTDTVDAQIIYAAVQITTGGSTLQDSGLSIINGNIDLHDYGKFSGANGDCT